MLSQITDEPTRNRISGGTDGQSVMVLYPGPLTGYPPKYPRDSIPVIKSYPDGISCPTPSKADFTPGQMLGCVLEARGY
jgi:formate dehydrogenase